jgi:Sulfotransferase family
MTPGDLVTSAGRHASIVSRLVRSGRGWVSLRSRPGAPPVPAGMKVGPPDFVGVGTARSGTTWWDALLHAHPAVVRLAGVPKEVHFFDRFWDGGFGDQDVGRYHAFFPRPEGSLAGEWTPGYMLQFWTPALLRRAAPDAKLLVLLRDPVERFRSALTLTEGRLTLAWNERSAANGAFGRGLYADQLVRLWRSFPRDQVLVLQYERCVRAPEDELRRTFTFLGLDPAPVAQLVRGDRVNPTRGAKVPLSAQQLSALAHRYADPNRRLQAMLPDLDLGLWTLP